ncbi:hypothetical protein ACLSU7_03755 [Bdellovibrio sp. HCB185ZH]|uniref:spermine/spermidine synthase domain-containing protein n=1 Tax=Bdellovibrio sp. HCB185ZH TaxID=3394235 RepID=UPI0039A5A09D
MTLGDLYITFLLVTLTFISGTALGSLLSSKIRRYLPWVEILTGIYNLGLFLALSLDFYKIQPPQFVVVLGLLLPAVSLGIQLPLYSYYLRRIRFNFIYGLYHGGAILGLLAFEIYFTFGLSVKASLLALSLGQIGLGAVLVFLLNHDIFHVDQSPSGAWKKLFTKNFLVIPLSVFLISALSSYQVFWALKTQVFLTEAFRLHATLISAAVFFWMTVAGFSEKRLHNASRTFLFFAWAAALLVLQSSFSTLPPLITENFTGNLSNYFIWSSVLALCLTLPVFASSLVFIKSTQELSVHFPVDQASGYLNAIACLGNILGMVLAAFMAPYLWTNFYFSTALGILIFAVMILTYFDKKYALASWGFVVLVIFAFFAFQKDQASGLFNNRFVKQIRPASINSQIFSEAFSSIAVMEDPITDGQVSLHYIVDGHRSHIIDRGTENLIGLYARRYFADSLEKSAVIGVGTGQTSWGVTAISEHTDLIEISPTVLKNLQHFKEYNNDLANNPHKSIHLIDGMSYLRNCPAGSYDLIVNTATYPGNFNAAKLYTLEFVELVKSCLKPHGVYQTYFDGSTVHNVAELADFLAPIQAHFKHIDIIAGYYPILMAYNESRPLSSGPMESFLRESDARFYNETLKKKPIFNLRCNFMYRDIPLYTGGKMNTLDRAVLEATSIRNIINNLYQRDEFIFADYSGLPRSQECF